MPLSRPGARRAPSDPSLRAVAYESACMYQVPHSYTPPSMAPVHGVPGLGIMRGRPGAGVPEGSAWAPRVQRVTLQGSAGAAHGIPEGSAQGPGETRRGSCHPPASPDCAWLHRTTPVQRMVHQMRRMAVHNGLRSSLSPGSAAQFTRRQRPVGRHKSPEAAEICPAASATFLQH